MAPYLATCDAARKRFAREAQAAAAVTHDNVVDIFGVAESNGLPYLVMPYFKGYTLQKRLDENGKLPTLEILRIGYQLAAGLAAAHQQGLVHRDIKPANIMMQEGTERLVITDFGLARAVDDATVTRTSIVAGTPHYMSPEQARGETVDHRSDLFSLGTLLYLCCTSKLPFDAQSPYGILRKVTDAEPIAIRTLNNQIPTWIESIVVKLLSKPVESRYQSAQEVADLFAGCLNHLQQPNTSLPPSLIQKVPRRLLHGWLCTCALIIAIGSIVWLTMLGSKLDNATDTSSPHTTNQASIESSTTQQPQQITDEDELEWIDTESQQIYEEALRLEESLTLDSL
jgi:serine/threonine protein kinase